MILTSNYGLGYADDNSHNSVLIKGNVLLGSINNAISAGNSDTRAFATYVLDALLDFTNNNGAYDSAVNRLHREFQDEVKSNLIPAMTDSEAAVYMISNVLESNSKDDMLDMLFNFNKTKDLYI